MNHECPECFSDEVRTSETGNIVLSRCQRCDHYWGDFRDNEMPESRIVYTQMKYRNDEPEL